MDILDCSKQTADNSFGIDNNISKPNLTNLDEIYINLMISSKNVFQLDRI